MTPSTFALGRRPRNTFLLTTTATGVALVLSSGALATPPTDQQRLERLVERIEAARVEQHIPGVALAVVRDDEIVFARGFGLASIEDEIPVTPETIFAIGSSTKAFTGAIIGMLVDEGAMTWDDPVAQWLPYFTPQLDGDDDAEVLIRDMLCHRTGFTRMGILWAGGEVPREQILRTANGAEPWAPFREQFLYNNVMFMAAGMAAGRAADSSWETLVRDRIFRPLGMDDSCLTIEEAQADSRLALGYNWKTDREEWKHAPMRNINGIGPAGSINSNVLDMAQWLRFQLGRGGHGSQRLLSAESHAETWSPQMKIAGNVSYGFGWMLREWNDLKVVEHGGNIDGFGAQVSLLPEKNLGYVLLTNTSVSTLQQGSIDIVFDALTGDWEMDADDGSDDDAGAELEEFTGVYVANYATFEDEKFTVQVQGDGRLAIDIPSQMVYSLKAPGDDGRRDFADVQGIAATFERDEAGEVCILRLYQNNLKFDVPREGYEFPVEIPLDELDTYLGKYHFAAMNADVEVIVKNNHLAVDIPNQMVFELHPPDEDDKWQFRNNDVTQIAVSFTRGEYGKIESMTLYQSGQEFTMPRQPDVADEDVPTLAEVFALADLDARQAALEAAAVVRLSGTARFAQAGVEGEVVTTFDADDRHHSRVDVTPFATIVTSLDGDQAWTDISVNEFEQLSGPQLQTMQRDHPASYLGDWRLFCDEIRLDGVDEVDGRRVIVLKLKTGELPVVTLSIDAETGDIVKIDTAVEVPAFGAQLPVTTYLRDWRDVDGLRVPHEMVVETLQNGRFIMTVREVETGVEIEPGFFTISRK